MAASFIMYPKPFGIQAEYNYGRGPEFNKLTDSIEVQKLHGGYITLSYFIPIKKEILMPFFRAQYFNGGKKHELDARSYEVKEFEIGVEWQPIKQFELTAMYTFSNRRFEDFALQDNHQKGKLLRLQAQINF
jgi:phosphate-selective porin